MWGLIIGSVVGNFIGHLVILNWAVTIGVFLGQVSMVSLLWVFGYLPERD